MIRNGNSVSLGIFQTMNVEQKWLLIHFFADRELILIIWFSYIAAVTSWIGGCIDAGVSLNCTGIVLVRWDVFREWVEPHTTAIHE